MKMNKVDNAVNILGASVSGVGYALATDQVLQTVFLVLSILSVLFVVVRELVRFSKWLSYRIKALKEGNLKPAELLDEIGKIADEGIEKIDEMKDNIKKGVK